MARRRRIFIFAVLISFILSILSGGKFPYLIFTILATALFYSYYSIKKAVENLYHFFWISNKIARVGDVIEIGYKINNTGIIPIFYSEINCNIAKRLGNMVFPKEVAFIKPLQMISVRKKFEIKHRGFYRLGRLNIVIRDFLNVFERNIVFDKNVRLVVYPRIWEISKMKIPATEFFGTLRTPRNTHEDYTNIKDIREYNRGDNVKKIHWKISAKLNDLYVKDYELSANTKINIFIDGYRDNFTDDYEGKLEEKMVEAAASIVNYCLKNNLVTAMITNTNERRYLEGRSLDKLEQFLKELIGFSPVGSIPLYELLIAESRKLYYGSTLLILTTKLDKKLFDILLSLRKRKFNILYILITHENLQPAYESRIKYLKESGIDIYCITDDADIRNVLEVY